MKTCDTVLVNATIIDKTGVQILNQAIAIAAGKIVWLGQTRELPDAFLKDPGVVIEECEGRLVTPGLIDCHTHLVYAGNRADEFMRRLQGESYSDIARAGGGIISTVTKTRKASEEQLFEESLPRLEAMCAQGVTTVEIKSGYGLDLVNELKMLRVARRLGEKTGVRVKTTFLGAHAIPPEFKGNTPGYVDYVCDKMLPAVAEAQLADAVDVFCETIAFNLAETEQIYDKAITLGLPIKCHAEQLSAFGAARLACNKGALSCDHLEYLTAEGAQAMANKGSVAVLLPGAFYFLREKTPPPVQLLRDYGVGIAIATDCNPGSSPTTSLLLMLNMACQFFSMTVPEVLSAVTYQAARALGLADEIGQIAVGFKADLNLWSIQDSAVLCYYFGQPLPHGTMINGNWV
ncbi:MAG: imidazolonepropionase [Legionellales bacterium RIFCSPHIGHO2_12_FULL_42_9]|nr:MAG: imidazolonepropionase [Legionellales bacterium RIFCSPHIGHO2_12_FULL_42_9]